MIYYCLLARVLILFDIILSIIVVVSFETLKEGDIDCYYIRRFLR